LRFLLILTQDTIGHGELVEVAAQYIEQYIDLPRLEIAPLHLPGKQLVHQPIELRQDVVAV
jgi:hypothetical protein